MDKYAYSDFFERAMAAAINSDRRWQDEPRRAKTTHEFIAHAIAYIGRAVPDNFRNERIGDGLTPRAALEKAAGLLAHAALSLPE